jgi:hypothetical protein
MEYAIPHQRVLDVIFSELREYLIEIDDDGSCEALYALDLLDDALILGVHGPELAETIMLHIARMCDYLAGCEVSLPEDVRIDDVCRILRPLRDRLDHPPPAVPSTAQSSDVSW